jgi:hypothetical protein
MRAIEIDFDVHKCIEAERRGFDESPNDALRRLLKLPEKEPVPSVASETMQVKGQRAWEGDGVILPHDTKLRMEYGRPKRVYQGAIIDGDWMVNGQIFDSPSGAASGVAITGSGGQTRLNAWTLWEVQRPGDVGWIHIDTLRKSEARRVRLPEATLEDLGLAACRTWHHRNF